MWRQVRLLRASQFCRWTRSQAKLRALEAGPQHNPAVVLPDHPDVAIGREDDGQHGKQRQQARVVGRDSQSTIQMRPRRLEVSRLDLV